MKTLIFRSWALPAFALLLLAGLSWAGVFQRESAEDVGRKVKESKGAMDVVAGTIVSRTAQKNALPGWEDTYVTVLEVSGKSLITQSLANIRVAYLGASWNPALQYSTTIEPQASVTDLGKQVVMVVEKEGTNAAWSVTGFNRIASIVRNSSGQEIAISPSSGFFVNENMALGTLETRIRKAAGLK